MREEPTRRAPPFVGVTHTPLELALTPPVEMHGAKTLAQLRTKRFLLAGGKIPWESERDPRRPPKCHRPSSGLLALAPVDGRGVALRLPAAKCQPCAIRESSMKAMIFGAHRHDGRVLGARQQEDQALKLLPAQTPEGILDWSAGELPSRLSIVKASLDRAAAGPGRVMCVRFL